MSFVPFSYDFDFRRILVEDDVRFVTVINFYLKNYLKYKN